MCRNVETMRDAMEDGLVDLLLYDYDSVGDEILNMTRKLRRRSFGRNPFVIAVATMTDSNLDKVRKLVDVGVDDLIRKPMSSKRLFTGIKKFAQSRKPFVASHDYVGPTRRSGERDEKDMSGLIEVPNTLRCKVYQNMSDQELQRLVEMAQFELDDRCLEATATEIDRLTSQVLAAGMYPEDVEVIGNLLLRIDAVAMDLFRRTDTVALNPVGALTKLLLSLVQRIQGKLSEPIGTELELLGKIAKAICRSVTVERDAVELMQEIVGAVAGYTGRIS